MLLIYIFRFFVPISAHIGMPVGYFMSISYTV